MAPQQLGKYLLASVARILLIHSLQNLYLTQRLLRVSPRAQRERSRSLAAREGGEGSLRITGEVGDIMWNLLNWTKPDSESNNVNQITCICVQSKTCFLCFEERHCRQCFQTHRILERFLVPALVEWVPWYLNINPTSKSNSHLMHETKAPKRSQIVTLRLGLSLSASAAEEASFLPNLFEHIQRCVIISPMRFAGASK